jgi:hypothetical protein
MLDLNMLDAGYTDIFFYASFHHLQNISDRTTVLSKAYELLEK